MLSIAWLAGADLQRLLQASQDDNRTRESLFKSWSRLKYGKELLERTILKYVLFDNLLKALSIVSKHWAPEKFAKLEVQTDVSYNLLEQSELSTFGLQEENRLNRGITLLYSNC